LVIIADLKELEQMMIELEEERPLYGAKVVQSFLYPTGVVKTLYIGKDDLPRFLPRLEMSPVNRFFFQINQTKTVLFENGW